MYTLDTNVVLYYIGNEPSVCARIEKALMAGMPLYVSAITVAELLRFPKLTPSEEHAIRTFLFICSVITIDMTIADRAGAIGRLHNVKLADSLIAATALFTNTTLLTRNVRDFKSIP